jgi:hypothetical protein
VVHLLGFAGSALIVMSVTMRSVAWLRCFGLAGSVMFMIYGALLEAWPVVVTNAVTTTIHLYQLRRLMNAPDRVVRRSRDRSNGTAPSFMIP